MTKLFEKLSSKIVWQDERNVLFGGDSLSLLSELPDRTVDLIVTDPPYHTTKKHNIMGDTDFDDDKAYLEWMRRYVIEWARILKPTGSLYCFCSCRMSSRLEVMMRESMTVFSNITWTKPNAPGFDGWKQKAKKESFREWYDHSEHVIFAAPSFEGNLFNSYFGNKLHEWRVAAGMTMKDLAEITKAYGKVNHGGAVANWEAGRNIPSEKQYAALVSALQPYQSEKLPEYNDVIRPFHVTADMEFTDVWTYQNVRPYKGKHPAEKPLDMLEAIISASSNEGDVVLDCFAGSGSTAIAALKLNRKAMSMEIDEHWISVCAKKFQMISDFHYSQFPVNYDSRRKDVREQPMFAF